MEAEADQKAGCLSGDDRDDDDDDHDDNDNDKENEGLYQTTYNHTMASWRHSVNPQKKFAELI